ncbi:hypothetical protein KUTeg_018049 [Tegillarca granosa]|uniref:Uncharacterized protein n=1 Tax=Tegillarca granosa TaxID=220873 RepID=A0ABQ9EKQ8_TEGGR|nr:hypothetical protein KUTeg_018049 [Tegillarca granosa]
MGNDSGNFEKEVKRQWNRFPKYYRKERIKFVFKNFGRNIDNFRDRAFRSTNDILGGKLIYNLQHDLSRSKKTKK